MIPIAMPGAAYAARASAAVVARHGHDGHAARVAHRLRRHARELADRAVHERERVEAERVGVLEVEPLDDGLGGEQRPVARGLLDPRALVDLVAEGGDLEPAARDHLAEVERAAPV